jgi:hypothetical protein
VGNGGGWDMIQFIIGASIAIGIGLAVVWLVVVLSS